MDSIRHRRLPGTRRWPELPVAARSDPAPRALVPAPGVASVLRGLIAVLLVALALAFVQPAKGSDGSDLVEAAASGDLDRVNELLAAGVDPDFKNGAPLRTAVNNGRDAVIDALLAAGADPDRRPNLAWEPALFYAVRQGDVATVEKLLRHGADPNISYNYYSNGETIKALHGAVIYGTGVRETKKKDGAGPAEYLAIVDRLLEAGANIDARSSLGNTPLSFAIFQMGYGGSKPQSLFSADSAAVIKGLFDRNAGPNWPVRGRSDGPRPPLSTIIRYFTGYYNSISDRASALSLVEHFLAAGADVNATDPKGETALDKIADLDYLGDIGSRIVAAIQGAGGVRSPRWKLLELDVHKAHTNSLVVTWRYPVASNRLTPRDEAFGTKNNDRVTLEYRKYGSGGAFQAGGTTFGGPQNGFGERFLPTVGVIGGLTPNTDYEIRARLERHYGSGLGEWSTTKGATTAPLRVRMETSRTVDGQYTFAGYVGSGRNEAWLTGDEGTVVFNDGAFPHRTYIAVRARGNDGPGSIPPRHYSFSRAGRTHFYFPGLHEQAEHEARIVTGYASTGSNIRSAESVYPDLFDGGTEYIDVSEWVRIGPNAPPRFDNAAYAQARTIYGENRGDSWGLGKWFFGEPLVSAIGTDGVLLCEGQDGAESLVKCALEGASDPDGDRLSYWLRRESGKFEVDSRTGEVRTKARGAAAIKRAFPESFKVPTFGFTDDKVAVEHVVILTVDDGRGGFDYAALKMRFSPSLSIVDAAEPIPTVPGAPTGLAASQSGGGISLNWTAPDADEAAPAIDYTVQWKSGSQDYADSREQGGIAATVATIADLAAGTEYTFRVRARNDAGFGPYSEEATVILEAANRAPTVPVAISDRTMRAGGLAEVDISGTFEDPDGDRLAYSVRSGAAGIVRAEIVDDAIAIAALAQGTATVTVEASDGEHVAVDSFEVTVLESCGSLLEASREGLLAEVRALIVCGAAVDEKDGSNRTPLHWASSRGHAGIVEILLAAGADPGAADSRGFTPEAYANAAGHFDIAAALRAGGGEANSWPVVEAIDDRRAVIGTTLTVAVSASDADPGDALSYSARSSRPEIVRAAMTDNVITITPIAEGTAAITVAVSDGRQVSIESFAVVVSTSPPPANSLPTIEAIDDRHTIIGADLTVAVDADDADPGDRLSYSALSSRPEIARAAVTGNMITVTPVAAGRATIAVEVSDGRQSAFASFEVSVSEACGSLLDASRKGVLTEVRSQIACGSDVNERNSTGWTPLHWASWKGYGEIVDALLAAGADPCIADNWGNAPAVYARAVGHFDVAEKLENLCVTSPPKPPGSPNSVPVIEAIDDLRTTVGADVTVAVSASDADPGDTLSHSVRSSHPAVARAAMTGNVIALTPLAGGTATITVEVSDGTASSTETFRVDVNHPPEIQQIEDLRTAVADDGSAKTLTVAVSASDADPGDTLSYSARSSDPGVARAAMTDNVITITPVAGGTATIAVEVSDGVTSSTAAFEVHVNHPPEILGLAGFTAFQGDFLLFRTGRVFSDRDGDRLLYKVESGSPFVKIDTSDADFQIVALGRANGPPVWPVVIKLSVSDGTNSTSREVAMWVRNRPPVLSRPLSQSVAEKCSLEVAVGGYDPDITDHFVHLVDVETDPTAIAKAEILGPKLIKITGSQPGETAVTVGVSDGKETTTGSFAVKVTENKRPEISPIADRVIYLDPPGQTAWVLVDARDPDVPDGSPVDCPDLIYTVQSKDPDIAQATIEGNEITIVPKKPGKAVIAVEVSDGIASSIEEFTVEVEKGLPVFWKDVDPLYFVLDPRQDAFREGGGCAVTRTIGEIGYGDEEDPASYSVAFYPASPGIVQAMRSGHRIEIEGLARGETGIVLEVRGREGVSVKSSVRSYSAVVAKSIDLVELAERGNLRRLEALLSVCANPNVRDADGWTPLHRAAQQGHHEVVTSLLSAGADPDLQDARGWTPLHRAAQKGHHEVVTSLLSAGADPNITNEHKTTPLHIAVAAGHRDVVDALLAWKKKSRLDLNVRAVGGNTPLHYAVATRNPNLTAVLLQAGADPDIGDRNGSTPLHDAVGWGDIELVRVLLGGGASRAPRDNNGKTPLNLAVALGHEEIAALLGGRVPDLPWGEQCLGVVGPIPVLVPVPCFWNTVGVASAAGSVGDTATPQVAGAVGAEGPSLTIAGTQVRLNEGRYADATESGYRVEVAHGAGGALAFDLSGDDRFELVEGRIRIKAGSAFDYETAADRYIELTVSAVNAQGVTVTAAVTVTISDVNEPPVVSDIGNRTAVVGRDLTIRVSATDPDGATVLRYSATSGDTAVATVSPASRTELVAGSGEVTVTPLAAGTTTVAVSVSDGENVAVRTFDVAVSGGSGQERLDRVSKAVLPDAVQAITESRLEAIAGRLERGPGVPSGGMPSVAGVMADIAGFLKANEAALNEGGLSWKRALAGRSFSLAAAGEKSDEPPAVTVWGGGDYRHLSGGGNGVDWSGDILTGHLGVDFGMRPDLKAGLVVDMSHGDFGIRDEAGPGNYDIRMTGLHGYMGRHWDNGSSLWWTTGVGEGEVALTDGGGTVERDDILFALAAGGAWALTPGWSGDTARPFALDLKGDISSTTFLDIDVQRARLAMEAAQGFALAPDGNLSVSGELGVRVDRRHSEVGSGVELGGSLAWRQDRLTVEGRGRVLLAHEDSRKEEWGIAGSVRLDPERDRSGLSLRMQPSIGATGSRMQELWHGTDARQLALVDDNAGARLDAELGYGVRLGAGVLTPYSNVGMSGNGSRNHGLGLKLELRSDTHIALEGRHRTSRSWPDEFELRFSMRTVW